MAGLTSAFGAKAPSASGEAEKSWLPDKDATDEPDGGEDTNGVHEDATGDHLASGYTKGDVKDGENRAENRADDRDEAKDAVR